MLLQLHGKKRLHTLLLLLRLRGEEFACLLGVSSGLWRQ